MPTCRREATSLLRVMRIVPPLSGRRSVKSAIICRPSSTTRSSKRTAKSRSTLESSASTVTINSCALFGTLIRYCSLSFQIVSRGVRVPGPISLSVGIPEMRLMWRSGGEAMVTRVSADCARSTRLIARTVTGLMSGTKNGAVYLPTPSMVPTTSLPPRTSLTCQMTVGFSVPDTVALNCC